MAARLDLRAENAYWLLRSGYGNALPRLTASLDCEIAIVGAGVTGALIAYELAMRGMRDIVVIDKRDRARGGTARSPALLHAELDVPLTVLDAQIGAERAARAYLACSEGIEHIEALGRTLGGVGFRRHESLYLATRPKDLARFGAELQARRGIGLEVRLLDGEALRERYGLRRPGALLSMQAAEVDPVRLTSVALDAAVARGVRCFGDVEVRRIADEANGATLVCDGRREIRCRVAIFCGGVETMAFLPTPVAQLYGAYAVVTRPAQDLAAVTSRPLVRDSTRPHFHARATTDGRTLLAGEEALFRSERARDRQLARRAAALTRRGQRLFGRLPPVEFAWCGTSAETVDALPYIGRLTGWHDRVHFALCYGGNGIVFAAQAAQILAAELEGRSHDLARTFGFERLTRVLDLKRVRGRRRSR